MCERYFASSCTVRKWIWCLEPIQGSWRCDKARMQQSHGNGSMNIACRCPCAGDNRLGGWYSYRGSKAALNQMTVTMSLETARRKQAVACMLLHPGTTKTGLSEPFQKVRCCDEAPRGKYSLCCSDEGPLNALGLSCMLHH